MKRNSKLSAALHALVHMVERRGRPMTSDELALCLQTNAVVVRRIIAGLREASIVASTKGHGGGLTLGRAPEAISIADVSAALGEPLVKFNTEAESPGCLIERSVMARLETARLEAERLLAERLRTITLADLAADAGPGISAHFNKDHAHAS
jgi:Rrf2 family protein